MVVYEENHKLGICDCRFEFSCENFGLKNVKKDVFQSSQWPFINQILFFIYRLLVAIYHVVIIILTGANPHSEWLKENTNKYRVRWFIYLTNWSFFFITFSTIVQLIASGCKLFRSKERIGREENSDDKNDCKQDEKNNLSLFYKFVWVVYNLNTNVPMLTGIAFWTLLYSGGSILYLDFLTHAVTMIYLIVDSALVAIPIRILHIYQSMILGLIYVIFSIIYDASGALNMLGKPYIYSTIDYSKDPGTAALYVVIILFVGIPVVHFIFYGFYTLRIFIFRKFFPKQFQESLSLQFSSSKEVQQFQMVES